MSDLEFLLKSAIDKKRVPEEFTFLLSGDLNQMSNQRSHLISIGLDVRQTDVYPAIKKEDVLVALRSIYKNRIPGWWNYEKECLQYEICTLQEFRNHFKEE